MLQTQPKAVLDHADLQARPDRRAVHGRHHKRVGRRLHRRRPSVLLFRPGCMWPGQCACSSRPRRTAARTRPLQPVLHRSWHDDDVPVRRAGHGRPWAVSGAPDVGTRNVPFPRINASATRSTSSAGVLLYVAYSRTSGRTPAGLRTCRSPAPIFARQARRCLGADDHVHRDRGAGRSRSNHRHGLQACARRACRSTAFRSTSGRCW